MKRLLRPLLLLLAIILLVEVQKRFGGGSCRVPMPPQHTLDARPVPPGETGGQEIEEDLHREDDFLEKGGTP